MIDRIVSFLNFVSLFFHKIGTIVLIPCLVALITIDVFLRYVFNSPITGSREINGFLLVMVFSLSLVYCWDQNRHIHVEILYSRFKRKQRMAVNIAIALTGMISFGLLGFHLISDLPFVISTLETGEELGIPVWPFRIIIALCAVLFFIKMLIHLINSLKK